MAAAAALSRVGHKVLLLEQHQTLGGLTHSFSRDGFTWDVGVHYLSEMAPGDRDRALLDWLSDTPIDFVSLGSVYDIVHIGSAEPLSLSRPYEAQERDLKDRFPDQAEAIEAWTHAMREGREAMYKIFPTRAMPEIAGDMLDWWNHRAIAKWCARTTKEVIDEITDDPELAAVMAAQWGDHGGRPSKASFAMHALIAGSYLQSGSWYPVGGGAAFAEHIIPTIAQARGRNPRWRPRRRAAVRGRYGRGRPDRRRRGDPGKRRDLRHRCARDHRHAFARGLRAPGLDRGDPRAALQHRAFHPVSWI